MSDVDGEEQRRRDLEKMEPATGEPLKDQMDLIDEDGDDIRQYTGEPVETDDGWVVPQQQSGHKDTIAGGGEWPDKDVPPAEPPAPD